jgi:hypothetical protein
MQNIVGIQHIINVSLPKELAMAFKAYCLNGNLSITGEMAQMIRGILALSAVSKKDKTR